MDSNKLKQELREYFDGMTREEIKELFTGLGFEVEDGKGKIIYTDAKQEFELNAKGDSFKMNQTYNFKVYKKEKIMYQRPMKIA